MGGSRGIGGAEQGRRGSVKGTNTIHMYKLSKTKEGNSEKYMGDLGVKIQGFRKVLTNCEQSNILIGNEDLSVI